jgi:hypothetical protein
MAMHPGRRKALPDTSLGRIREEVEKRKASVRAKVEHPFRIVKYIFDMKKVVIGEWSRTRQNASRCSEWPAFWSPRDGLLSSTLKACPDMDGQLKYAAKCGEIEAKITRERPSFAPYCPSVERLCSARVVFNEMLICSARPR